MEWYVDAENGSVLYTGMTPESPFALLSEAASAMITDGSSGQIVNIMANGGTPVIEPSPISLTGLVEPEIRARDAAGNTADDFLAFDWSDIPVVRFTGVSGIAHNTSSTFTTIRGIALEGDDSAYDAFSSTSSSHALHMYDCEVAEFALRAMRPRAGSTFTRCYMRDMPVAVLQLTAGLTFDACFFRDITDYVVDRTTSKTLLMRNCLFYHCSADNTAQDSPIERADNVFTPVNCLFVDNYCQSGIPGGTGGSNNCYTSDPLTYHTVGNYSSATSSDDYEHEPGFADAAGGDFRLSSDSLLLGLGTGDAVTYSFDRVEMTDPPPIGPFLLAAAPPVTIDAVAIQNAKAIQVTFSRAVVADSVALPTAWTLEPTGPGASLAVTEATVIDDVTVALELWPGMYGGVGYRVTAVTVEGVE